MKIFEDNIFYREIHENFNLMKIYVEYNKLNSNFVDGKSF